MVSQKIVITEPLGLHLRPAGKFCDEALKYNSKIVIIKGTHHANGKSVLGLLAARVKKDDEIEIQCDGSDEKEALEALTKILQNGFGM